MELDEIQKKIKHLLDHMQNIENEMYNQFISGKDIDESLYTEMYKISQELYNLRDERARSIILDIEEEPSKQIN